MANNIITGINGVIAKADVSFAAAGINSTNTNRVSVMGNEVLSYVPGRSLNGITGFKVGKSYLIDAKTNFDLEAFVAPPMPGPGEVFNPYKKNYQFNGANTAITVANESDYIFYKTTPFSVAFYGKIKQNGHNLFLGRSGPTNSDRCWDITVYGDANIVKVEAYIAGHDGAYFYKSFDTSIPFNLFGLFQFVFDGADIYLAVNGVVVGSSYNSGTVTLFKTGGNFAIGRRGALYANQGVMTQLTIIDRALTSPELTEMEFYGDLSGVVTGASWASDVIGYYQFKGNLFDSVGTHHGTATSPNYIKF